MFPPLAIVLLFVTDATPAVTAEGGDLLQIDLSRPFQAGQVFSYAAVGRTYRQTVVSTQGAVVTELVKGTRCELAAALAVDAVREDGRPQELTLRVFRLMVRDGFLPAEEGGAVNAGEQPLPTGTELRVRYPESGAGEPEVARADGTPLEASVISALGLVLPGPAGPRDDDVMFGNTEPTRVGQRWGIDAKDASRALAEGGIEVDADKLKGEVSLLEHDAGAGEHVVEVSLRGERAGLPMPKGYVTRAGTLKVRLRSTLPDELDDPLRKEVAEYSLQSQAMGREGDQLMVVDLAFFQSRSARYGAVGGSAPEAAGADE